MVTEQRPTRFLLSLSAPSVDGRADVQANSTAITLHQPASPAAVCWAVRRLERPLVTQGGRRAIRAIAQGAAALGSGLNP